MLLGVLLQKVVAVPIVQNGRLYLLRESKLDCGKHVLPMYVVPDIFRQGIQ